MEGKNTLIWWKGNVDQLCYLFSPFFLFIFFQDSGGGSKEDNEVTEGISLAWGRWGKEANLG